MITRFKLAAVFIVLIRLIIVTGSRAATEDIQYIYIEQYEDVEANMQLATELIGYAPGYLAAKVPAYDIPLSKCVSIGASSAQSGDEKAFIWIQYDCSDPDLIANKDDLKREMETFFTELAEAHVYMTPIFRWRGPRRANWVEDVFSGLGPLSYESFAISVKAKLFLEDWDDSCNKMKQEYGLIYDIGFYGGQIYGAINSDPEYIVLLYSVDFENGKKVQIFLTETLEGEEWKVAGWEVSPWIEN